MARNTNQITVNKGKRRLLIAALL